MPSEPSDWYVARVVMERDEYVAALRTVSEARRRYLGAAREANDAGWSWRRLGEAVGVDHARLYKQAQKLPDSSADSSAEGSEGQLSGTGGQPL